MDSPIPSTQGRGTIDSVPTHTLTHLSIIRSHPYQKQTQGFVETLDYILIEDPTVTGVEVLSTARMPTREEAGQDVALPSWRTPSDHVSLMCDLRLG